MCLTEDGVWELQAVLSSRGDCPGSGSGRPAVFTNMVEVTDWIYKSIGRKWIISFTTSTQLSCRLYSRQLDWLRVS